MSSDFVAPTKSNSERKLDTQQEHTRVVDCDLNGEPNRKIATKEGSDSNKSQAVASPPESKKERTLYTSKQKQQQVIKRRWSGESIRKIAREENLDRGTVDRILSQPELTYMEAEALSRLMCLALSAVKVLEEGLFSEDLKIAISTAKFIYNGVINKRGWQGTIDDAKTRQSKSGLDFLDDFQWPPKKPSAWARPKAAKKKPPRAESLASPGDVVGGDGGSQP